jgi:hypothetical protein
MSLGNLAAAEIKPNLVDPIGVDESKIIVKCPLRQQAVFAYRMTQLHAQP